MELFAGLDNVDWGAMRHAYGPAVEVPDLVRGLVHKDPAVRESALDSMYGAVHHQGSVYDSTVASIPFLLRAAGNPDLPGRDAIVELLASIGGADNDESGDVPEHEHHRRASEAVADASPMFLELLVDADPAVRRAACRALLVCRSEIAHVVTVLQGRMLVEADADVQAEMVRAIGAFSRRVTAGKLSGVDADSLATWLATMAADHPSLPLRLTALTELSRCAPDALPADTVATALELLSTVYATGTATPQPAGFSTPTVLGAIRQFSESEASGRRAPQAASLVWDLSWALDARTDDRIELLTALLGASGWECRYDAVRPAGVLIENWRGDYREMVHLIGEQLLDSHARLCAAAARGLEHLHELAEPARDALARSLDAAPRQAPHQQQAGPPAWVTRWSDDQSTTGPTLRALAALRDPRALPPVRWALTREHARSQPETTTRRPKQDREHRSGTGRREPVAGMHGRTDRHHPAVTPVEADRIQALLAVSGDLSSTGLPRQSRPCALPVIWSRQVTGRVVWPAA